MAKKRLPHRVGPELFFVKVKTKHTRLSPDEEISSPHRVLGHVKKEDFKWVTDHEADKPLRCIMELYGFSAMENAIVTICL